MSPDVAHTPRPRRVSPADAAYAQLSRALDRRAPECDGIDLFTADTLTKADAATLAPICAACDVALLCRQYAKAAKPTVGFWAGKQYVGRGRKAGQEAA
ncbi:WhiB family transcriptional regulator [Microbacterium sp. A93]|uniref:WhiB family transcriptional regulator n=1 Tax=Microbacterium sp. A93 TaxID=3450716 RepID=UPI003F41EAD6